MKITIQKYYKPIDSDKSSNLFSGNLTYIDSISFEKFLIDSLPSFNNEYYYQNDVTYFKAGDFSLKISQLIEETSESGNTIYEFFNEVEPSVHGREKYFVLVEITTLQKPSGIIQIDTIKAMPHLELLELSVTEISKELIDWMNSIFIQGMNAGEGNMRWESEYMPTFHFQDLNPPGYTLIFYSFDLDIDAKVGFPVYVESALQEALYRGGLNRGYTVWAGLESFMQQWGFKFTFAFTGWYGSLPRFQLTFKWRSDYTNDVGTITKFTDYEKSILISDPRWIFIQSGQLIESVADVDYYVGMLYNIYNTYIGESRYGPPTRIGYNANKNVFQIAGQPEIKAETVKVISSSLHAQDWLVWNGGVLGTFNINIAYAMIAYALRPTGQKYYSTILLTAALNEYKYLLAGLTAYRSIEVDISDIDLVAGSKATIDNKDFICEKIKAYNDFKKIAKAECRQIIT